MSTRPAPIIFRPVTKDCDVADEHLPAILRDLDGKSYHMVHVVQALYKESNGNNRSFPDAVARIIASFSQTVLEATSVRNHLHVLRCNQNLYLYWKDTSGEDSNEEYDRHFVKFISLDTNISELFRNGCESLQIKLVHLGCNKLIRAGYWFEFGLARCESKEDIDAVLNNGNLLRKNSLQGLVRKLKGPIQSGGLDVPDDFLPEIYWIQMKNGISAVNGKSYHGFKDNKLIKYESMTRDLTGEESIGQFSILIKKSCNGQIMLDDLPIDLKKYKKNNTPTKPDATQDEKPKHWYLWGKSYDCSCRRYRTGVVFELTCKY